MLVVKNWFMKKEFGLSNNQFDYYRILKETEKAYFLRAENDKTGDITFWCPKSCTEEIDYENEMTEEEELAMYKEWDKKLERGLEYNKKLKEYAKSFGIKFRGSRTATQKIIDKLNEAGIEVPTREALLNA